MDADCCGMGRPVLLREPEVDEDWPSDAEVSGISLCFMG